MRMEEIKPACDLAVSEMIPAKGTIPGVEVACEHTIHVFINRRLSMRLICTPQYLEELVAGRLLTENLIDGRDDIKSITVCGQGLEARAEINEIAAGQLDEKKIDQTPTCCTDNKMFVKRQPKKERSVESIPWESSWFDGIQERLSEGEPLFLKTHATHSCYLGRGSEVICCREDIGRHNAMDKVIGYGLLNGIDLTKCFLFTTGRMPTDMVRKAINAGIPLLASKTYPTRQAVEIADSADLTLVTVRKDGTTLVWSGGEDLHA